MNEQKDRYWKGTVWNVNKFEKITSFTLAISKKNKKTDEWEKGYIRCLISNDIYSHELTEKMRVEVDVSPMPNQWQDKEGKIHHDIQLWINDIRFGDSKESTNAAVMNDLEKDSAAGQDDELPFS